MCDQLVSFGEFRAILTPFSEVIRKAGDSIHRWPDLTPQIVSPQQEKSRIAIKTTVP